MTPNMMTFTAKGVTRMTMQNDLQQNFKAFNKMTLSGMIVIDTQHNDNQRNGIQQNDIRQKKLSLEM